VKRSVHTVLLPCLVATLAVLLVAGCTIVINPEPDTGISITVKGVAPWLVTDKPLVDAVKSSAARAVNPGSKALLVATRIEFELFQDGVLGMIATDAWDIADSNYGGSQTGIFKMTGIPPGSGYHLYARVYNDNNPEASRMVVFGEATNLTVVDGALSAASITCLPYNSTNISAFRYNYTYTGLQMGQEFWFSVVTPTALTRFWVQSSIGGDADVYIFDLSGNYLARCTGLANEEYAQLVTTAGGTYYIGLYAYSGGTGGVKISSL
jgi:hypothetical protein